MKHYSRGKNPVQEESSMMSEKPLANLYQLYALGDLAKKDLEGKVFLYLLKNFEQFHLFNGNREKWEEYLSWLYPRLARALDLYKDLGSSFDAYINSLIYCTAREYQCRETDHYITESVCWQAKAEEMKLLESEPEYPEKRKDFSVPDGVNPRQVLFLLLKSYYYVTESFVEKAARAIGMDPKVVLDMIDELRKLRSGKDEHILELRERLHCQHYRCLAYQKRMDCTMPGTDYHEKMKSRFERARKRFYTMKKRLGGVRMGATNRMIAAVLGIPKGTVDSALYVVKNLMDSGLQKSV